MAASEMEVKLGLRCPVFRSPANNDRYSWETSLVGVHHEMNRSRASSNDDVRLMVAILFHVPLSNLLLRDRILKQVRFHVLNIQINVINRLTLQNLANLLVNDIYSSRRPP